MFSRSPGKVSRCDVDFVRCKQKVFPLSGKVMFIWDRNYIGHRDLTRQQARSRYPGKLFVPYEGVYLKVEGRESRVIVESRE